MEAWLGDNGRRLRRARPLVQPITPASPVLTGGPSRGRTTSFPTFRDTVQAAEYVRDNLPWSVRQSSSLHPNLLPLHFMAYYPEFDHIVAMQLAHTAHIAEMVQAIFYAMVINDAAELRLIRRETEESLTLDLQELRWDIIEAWLLSIEEKLKDTQVPRLVETVHNLQPHPAVTSRLRDAPPYRVTRSTIKMPLPFYVPLTRGETSAQRLRPLLEDHLVLCPSFDLGHGYTVIFYAMVVNEVAERVFTCRISLRCLIWALQQLHWDPFEFWFENVEYRLRGARALCPVNPPTDLASSSGPVEALGLGDAPPVSSVEQ
ncbi:hypothetical protein Cgig2_019179 [Carnegiea gigantea]|uniref:Uncharacterized protein n=1 Tax=Carnegiea gigantea TaxID=171969 RepID=A0A9Q1JYR3_9CARY|nr:hypothetical protein Cgig2_019179 [Carnegiea gigantea]